jgi:hypothetical protein
LKGKIKSEFSVTKAEIQDKLKPLTMDQKPKNSPHHALKMHLEIFLRSK